ncbi:hypothetical protein PABG_01286 [Paracoccidioides brasiliensis Pb03]|nr:hypothetical protein PABG_01286 [Paracoccidioides brasiliensis Pb03]
MSETGSNESKGGVNSGPTKSGFISSQSPGAVRRREHPKVASKIRAQCELPRLPSLSQTPGPRNFAGAVFAGATSGGDTYLFDHQNKRSD